MPSRQIASANAIALQRKFRERLQANGFGSKDEIERLFDLCKPLIESGVQHQKIVGFALLHIFQALAELDNFAWDHGKDPWTLHRDILAEAIRVIDDPHTPTETCSIAADLIGVAAEIWKSSGI